MANTINGSGSPYSSIANPFEQRQNQQVGSDGNKPQQTGDSGQTKKPQQTSSSSSSSQPSNQNVQASNSDQKGKAQASGNRGSLVDITV